MSRNRWPVAAVLARLCTPSGRAEIAAALDLERTVQDICAVSGAGEAEVYAAVTARWRDGRAPITINQAASSVYRDAYAGMWPLPPLEAV